MLLRVVIFHTFSSQKKNKKNTQINNLLATGQMPSGLCLILVWS